MKKFSVLLLTIPLLFACKKKLTHFGMDYNTQIVVSSTFGQLVPVQLYTPEITSNAEAEFESNDTKKKYVKSIYLKEAILTIQSPSNETFSFLNKISIYLESANVAEQKIAELTDIPANVGTQISLNALGVDLQEYIKEDRFKIKAEYVTDETIPQDVTIDIYTDFMVEAQLKRF